MKKLPLGITTFKDIRKKDENFLYVDKTEIVYNLIQRGKYYFLSRPRRFGKSLFLDTLADLFLAKKELFEDLYIYDKWDWSESYPVIRIDFAKGQITSVEDFEDKLKEILEENERNLGVEPSSYKARRAFSNLIENTYKKYNQKVVILIDEYDKAILDNISNIDIVKDIRNGLGDFYSVIKGSDKYIKFVFMTGVSKFSKMNLFSGLNNLQDITVDKKYSTICGYTHNDIKTLFKEHLQGVDLEKLKMWYNGYNYFGEAVYNPYDILLFISNDCEYKNYWWSTGNPRFLIEKLKESNYSIPQLENIVVSDETLNSFDIEHIDLVALLWQTGYLTFDKKIEKRAKILSKLKVPNLEIQLSLNELFLKYLTNQTVEIFQYQDEIDDAITLDIANLKNTITSLFASIPYNNYVKNELAHYEGYYASVIYTYFVSLGYISIAEDVTNRGRIDLTLKLPNRIVIIEFKVDMNESALEQVKTKKYYEKYLDEEKDIYIVGISFSSKEKNVTAFEYEKIEKN